MPSLSDGAADAQRSPQETTYLLWGHGCALFTHSPAAQERPRQSRHDAPGLSDHPLRQLPAGGFVPNGKQAPFVGAQKMLGD